MTHFEDLSAYTYFPPDAPGPETMNVGWLDAAHDFPTEEPSPAFLEKLWAYCRVIVNSTRGLHDCELCARPENTFFKRDAGLLLGSGEIRVFSPEGDVFAAPNLIYHYVNDHKYRPPLQFIRAVAEGPVPFSDEYSRLLDAMGLIWRENPLREGGLRPFKLVQTADGIKKVFVDE